MKSLLVSTFFGLSILSSANTWSYGSEIPLAPIEIMPGNKMSVKVVDLPIFQGVRYKLYCTLQPLTENSHMKIEASYDTMKIWAAGCTNSAIYSVVCPIEKSKEIHLGINNIDKSVGGTISLTNLDTTQTFSISCMASPVV